MFVLFTARGYIGMNEICAKSVPFNFKMDKLAAWENIKNNQLSINF